MSTLGDSPMSGNIWEYLVDLEKISKVVKTKTFETNLQSLSFFGNIS